MNKHHDKFIKFWKYNLRQPSTWAGLFLLFLTSLIYSDKILLHEFLLRLIHSNGFLELIFGLISGALIMHNPRTKE